MQKLLILMLELFPSCFQLWAQEFMSCQSMSCALLNYMKQHLGQINTAEFPRAYLVQFLSQCCTFSKGEAPKLCEVGSVCIEPVHSSLCALHTGASGKYRGPQRFPGTRHQLPVLVSCYCGTCCMLYGCAGTATVQTGPQRYRLYHYCVVLLYLSCIP